MLSAGPDAEWVNGNHFLIIKLTDGVLEVKTAKKSLRANTE